MYDWLEAPAEEFCESVRDGTHDSPKPVEDGRYLITSRHITGDRIDLSNAYRISQTDFDEVNRRSKVDRWDVLITMIGTVGDVCLVREEPNFAIKNIGLFKTKGEKNGKWLYYYMKSPFSKTLIESQKRGTTQAYIPLGDLRRFPIKYPKDEGLAGAIISLLSSLDDKIELNRRINETLEAMARAIFKDWFVDFGPTRTKAEGRAPYLAPELWDLFPDALDGESKPVGWYQSSLGNELSVLETGKRPRGGVAGISEGIPSVGAESIVKVGEFVFSKTKYVPRDFFSKMTKGHVSDGDVLIYKDGGKPGELRPAVTYISKGFPFAEFCINEHVFRIRTESLSQPLLYCLLSTDDAFWQMRELATGVAQPGLNQTAIKSITFTMPDDQRLLCSAEAVIDPIVDGCNGNSLNSLALAQTRDLLLPKLMSGEIRLREAMKVVEAVA